MKKILEGFLFGIGLLAGKAVYKGVNQAVIYTMKKEYPVRYSRFMDTLREIRIANTLNMK